MRLFTSLLLILFSQSSESIIPQAIQDGPLKIFKSYSDVTIFHFSVPPEIIKATWQFAALMDGKHCIPRRAYIHLQWGSFPVISNSNSTAPNVFLRKENSFVIAATTTYKAEATVVFPVDSPQPGDWFAAAYLDYFDERVQQDGIGYKCHYSIGSVAIWTQENDIKNIPTGFKTTMRTNQPSTYFKFLIPSGTLNFRLTIWNCRFTFTYSNRHPEVCIKAMSIKAQKLPVINHMHSNSNVNLTTNSTYTFDEQTPSEESYYYLLILSDSVIDFNIEITITECPVKITEGIFANQWILNINNSLKIKPLNELDSLLSNLTSKRVKTDFCPRRLKLTRVKKLQTFSTAYLFHSKNGLSPWIMLTDEFPLIIQFNVIPIVDIGGSLDIGIVLEVDKSLLKQKVVVNICVQRSKIPGHINCQGNHDLKMNLSSSDKVKGNFIIPYPQPDTWYIYFQTKCYSNGVLENCTMSGILASLNIQTQECVFSGENSCSNRGVCQELHRGLFHFTTCNCFKGYKGWGCTDESDVNSRSSFVVSSVLLLISNIFFLPAIYLAIKRTLYAQALIYFSTMLFSSLYHACDQKLIGYCISKYEVLQFSDFFSSILSFWMTLITMAKLPAKIECLAHIFGVIIISFNVELNRTSLSSILVPSIIGIFIPISAHIYHCFKIKIFKCPSKIYKLIIGIILASSGFIIYALVETEANYEYVHSVWHIIIAISLVFLLPSVSVKQKIKMANQLAIDSFNNVENEFLQLKDRSDSPIFTIVTS